MWEGRERVLVNRNNGAYEVMSGEKATSIGRLLESPYRRHTKSAKSISFVQLAYCFCSSQQNYRRLEEKHAHYGESCIQYKDLSIISAALAFALDLSYTCGPNQPSKSATPHL